MRDLIETTITIALALAALVVAFHAYGNELTGLITQAFTPFAN